MKKARRAREALKSGAATSYPSAGKRGRKPSRKNASEPAELAEGEASESDLSVVEGGLGALCGVRGTFLKESASRPRDHAVGLVLGCRLSSARFALLSRVCRAHVLLISPLLVFTFCCEVVPWHSLRQTAYRIRFCLDYFPYSPWLALMWATNFITGSS